MEISDYQREVDEWIRSIGVRYFDVLTNTIILSEEVGEFSGLIARIYGEQSFKKGREGSSEQLKDEMGDILFVITCLANQLDFDLEDVINRNAIKRTSRDRDRHKKNPKL